MRSGPTANILLISRLSSEKYGRLLSASRRAFLILVEEIRYIAFVIFCVSPTLFILFLISFVLAIS